MLVSDALTSYTCLHLLMYFPVPRRIQFEKMLGKVPFVNSMDTWSLRARARALEFSIYICQK